MSSARFIRNSLIKNYKDAYTRANGKDVDVVYSAAGWYEIRTLAIRNMPGIKGDKMRTSDFIKATNNLTKRAEEAANKAALSLVVTSHTELLPLIFDRDTGEAESFREDLTKLRDFTEGCRPSMHEPDEVIGEVQVKLTGNHLDNAGSSSEYALQLSREDGKTFSIRVTDLLALARMAVIIEK